MSESLVDWRLAERIAGGVSGGEDAAAARSQPLRPETLAATCAEAERLVRGYSLLEPTAAIPAPEPVDRAAWTRAILVTLRELASGLEAEGGVDGSTSSPLGGVGRRVIGVAGGTELGLAVGYASRRVLGQYDLALVGAERPPRLLFVAPNLAGAAVKLEAELEGFVRWVALHETTHAIQFSSAPWLREHLGGLIRELMSGALASAGLGDLLRRLAADPRGAVSAFLKGNVASALAGPDQAAILDRLQAAMTVIEGHAEHVMDAAGGELVPDLEGLRGRLEARRAARGPVEAILARLLGLDLKLRQYKLGKAFCDEVVEREGIAALNRTWSGAQALPDLSELAQPERWLDRTSAIARA